MRSDFGGIVDGRPAGFRLRIRSANCLTAEGRR